MQENQEQEELEEIPKPRLWYFLQLISLIIMALLGGAMFGLLAMALCEPLFGVSSADALAFPLKDASPALVNASKFVHVFNVIGTFVFSAISQLAFMREPIVDGLGIKIKFPPVQAVLAIAAILVLHPAISWLADWTLTWNFPESMKDTEESLRQIQENTTKQQLVYLQNQGWGDFLGNIFIAGLVAAFCEELFFRRIMLRLLFDTTRNVHVSIAISALLFALIHGQFFYLLPLFALGILLGYLAYWSKSLWLPVLAHFSFNTLTVCQAFFADTAGTNPENLSTDFGYPLLSAFVSVLIGAFLILALYKKRLRD